MLKLEASRGGFLKWSYYGLLVGAIQVFSFSAFATDLQESKEDRPRLFTPLVSSAPKFGTSLGAMGAYLHRFDEQSPASMFGAMASYSNTNSRVISGFARTYFDQDRQRLMVGAVSGEVHNEYTDFLGTGATVRTTDSIRALFLRYLYRIRGDWFIGPQGLSTNYAVTGHDWLSDTLLDRIGLSGFDSNGLGLVVERDTRDNQNAPNTGSRFFLNNVAYRKSFGGDSSFDAYALGYSHYLPHGQGHVFASRLNGRWTAGADPAGYSTVMLRGYTAGQYLAPHSTLIEVEERFHLFGRWGLTAFAGANCMYGNGMTCDERSSWLPAAGVGVTFVLHLEENMLARAEFADGKGENHGFYMKFGYEY